MGVLGYDREQNIFALNDTAQLRAYLYDTEDSPIRGDDIFSVRFTVQKPDKTKSTITGDADDDGLGTAFYEDTDQEGHYVVVVAFGLEDGTRSTRADFEVFDPFLEVSPSPSWVIADAAWRKFEDCYDAIEEGPHLRDETLNIFNKEKMETFIAEALFDINQQNPPTALDLSTFSYSDGTSTFATPDLPLMAQGVEVAVIRHLMRSYVEQPNPVGVQVGWHDRRDYLTRWQSVYQTEYQQYLRMLALFKRRYLGLGQTALLVSSKAGRLIAAPMRTRMAGRGYW